MVGSLLLNFLECPIHLTYYQALTPVLHVSLFGHTFCYGTSHYQLLHLRNISLYPTIQDVSYNESYGMCSLTT